MLLIWDESTTDTNCKIGENGGNCIFSKEGVSVNNNVSEQKCRQNKPLVPTSNQYHPGKLRADLTIFRAHHYASIQHKGKRQVANFILDNVGNDGPWWYWTCCHQEGRTASGCTNHDYPLENLVPNTHTLSYR